MKKVSSNDMVFDRNMNPIWCNSPTSCKDWLRYQLDGGYSISGYTVRTGWPQRLMSAHEYIGKGRDK